MTIKLNPDHDHCEKVRDAVAQNDGYCPCQLERNENTKCICQNFLNDEKEGYCHCGLYFKTLD